MATLVASASASSLYSSVQPEENDVFNDPLSFSNQTLPGKRKTGVAVVPKNGCGTRSLNMHIEEYDSEDSNLLSDNGLFLGSFYNLSIQLYPFCFFVSRCNVYCPQHWNRSREQSDNELTCISQTWFRIRRKTEKKIEVFLSEPCSEMGC